jgi:hypothetical protein
MPRFLAMPCPLGCDRMLTIQLTEAGHAGDLDGCPHARPFNLLMLEPADDDKIVAALHVALAAAAAAEE